MFFFSLLYSNILTGVDVLESEEFKLLHKEFLLVYFIDTLISGKIKKWLIFLKCLFPIEPYPTIAIFNCFFYE